MCARSVCLWLGVLLCPALSQRTGTPATTWTGRLLVVPMDGSHWTGLKAVAEELGHRGHTVVVVMPEVSMRLDSGKHYITKRFPVPYGPELLEELQARNTEALQSTTLSLMERISSRISSFKKFVHYQQATSEGLLLNQELLDFLREQNFDALLTSPAVPTGAILAYNLSLPAVYMLRGLPCGMDSISTACPDPPSYVPRFFTKNSDHMCFSERVLNVLVSMVEPLICKAIYWSFEDVASRFLQRAVSMKEILSTGALWLFRYDFTMEFPRPLMPNMVLIGGLNCAIRSPLSLFEVPYGLEDPLKYAAYHRPSHSHVRTAKGNLIIHTNPALYSLLNLDFTLSQRTGTPATTWTGRLLVVPMDGSHWTGLKAVAEELGHRGHTVVVVMPEVSMRLDSGKHYITKRFPVPYGPELLEELQARNTEALQSTTLSLMERISSRISSFKKFVHYQQATSEGLLLNQELLDFLREQNFDALLTSPAVPTGAILAYNLSLPAVYMLRGLPCGMDSISTACPDPPSYVPRFFTKNSDHMCFSERVLNVLVSMVEPLICKAIYWSFEDVASRFLQRTVSMKEILSTGALWLFRYDFTMEFPRPLMPNMVLIVVGSVMQCEGWRSVQAPGLLLWLCASWGLVQGSRVLIMPVDGSHWLSLQLLVAELAHRGHDLLVLVPETSILIGDSDLYRTEHFPVPYTQNELSSSLQWMTQGVFHRTFPLMDIVVSVRGLLNFTDMQVRGCAALLYNEALMERLKQENFQMLLTDPFLPCGTIISAALQLPAVYFLRGMPCGLDVLAMQCPAPPSYVPRYKIGSSDHMGFAYRLHNFVMVGVELLLCQVMYRSFDELATRYLERDVTYRELLGHGVLWLLRYDFTLEYPRPVMPNMIFIGGINCGKSLALAPDIEDFVEGSGKHGIVVFTLGSLVRSMPVEKASIFFKAFSQIPQRVLWRYTGDVPEKVPENVKLMKWLPQNDLLGHPKTRAFITHGGTHGIYEGICHGVPMVMVPLFGDQDDNVHRMANRGVGVILNIHELTVPMLVDALNTVINNSSYKERMMKLSAVHNDRPIEPLNLAVFWTEFVMRHKGAGHLRPAAHDLNWFQYHSLDVIVFLLAVMTIVVTTAIKCCTFCLHRCYRKSQKWKEE
ncbi:UDP glucuronosyltransferase 1 family, polypeptide B1 [Electrophorus electricus]|nr:UDP glucuronosyltransferase 1 family, polypeptide B1 [Electrophorus electricus]